MDEKLPVTSFDTLQLVSFCSMAIFTAGLTSPYVLLLMLPCILYLYWIAKFFICASRSLKRMDGKTRSPIFALFAMTYAGLPTIRAFNNTNMILNKGLSMIDINSRIVLTFVAVTRWSAVNLDIMAAILTGITGIVCVTLAHHTQFSSAAVGLVLTYTISLAAYLQRTIRQIADMESFMTSTERVCEYKEIKSESERSSNVSNLSNLSTKKAMIQVF